MSVELRENQEVRQLFFPELAAEIISVRDLVGKCLCAISDNAIRLADLNPGPKLAEQLFVCDDFDANPHVFRITNGARGRCVTALRLQVYRRDGMDVWGPLREGERDYAFQMQECDCADRAPID